MTTVEAARFAAAVLDFPEPWRFGPVTMIAAPMGAVPLPPQPVGLDVARVASAAQAAGVPRALAREWAAQVEVAALAAWSERMAEHGDQA